MSKRKESTADQQFVEQAKRQFDASVDGLDAATRSKLNRGRQEALAELGRGGIRWLEWSPAAGLAAAAVLAVVLWTGNEPVSELAPDSVADIEILLTEDSLEMLENLEFYSWIDLDEQTDTPGGNVG